MPLYDILYIGLLLKKEGEKMKICSFLKSSTLDFPSKIVSVIFLGSCNISCEYCHNKELINPKDLEEVIDKEELIKFLIKRKNILDGICISGGEATLHGHKLISLIKEIKERVSNKFLIKLDTNGTNLDILKEALIYLDYVAVDYKSYDYEKNLGIDKNKVLETISFLKGNNIDYEVRLTMYPPYIKKEDIDKIIKDLAGVKTIYLQEYKRVEGGKEKNYTLDELKEIRNKFVDKGFECEIRC